MSVQDPPGSLLLFSTSPEPAPSLAVELAQRRYATRPDCLRLVVLQTPLAEPSPSQVEILLRQFSGNGIEIEAHDPGLQTREDAFRDDVVDAIRCASIVLVTGGDPGRMMRIVSGTPALDALREARAGGAVVGGGSAEAMVFGHGMLDGPRGEQRALALLGWLPDIVIAPHFGNYPIEPWREAFPGSTILGLPDSSVAVVSGREFASVGEESFTVIPPGARAPIEVPPGATWTAAPERGGREGHGPGST